MSYALRETEASPFLSTGFNWKSQVSGKCDRTTGSFETILLPLALLRFALVIPISASTKVLSWPSELLLDPLFNLLPILKLLPLLRATLRYALGTRIVGLGFLL